jgi:hypothetical protein
MTLSYLHLYTRNSNSITVEIVNKGGEDFKYYGGEYATLAEDDGDPALTKCFESSQPLISDSSSIELKFECYAFTGCDYGFSAEFQCAPLHTDGVAVLSDVDDTILAAHPHCHSYSECLLSPADMKHFLAGVDDRLEGKRIYPGARSLYLGLALGKDYAGDDSVIPVKPKLLSARPAEAGSLAAIRQDSDLAMSFTDAADTWGLPTWGVNLDGSMYGSAFDADSDLEEAFQAYGERKADSFVSLYESEDKVWTGPMVFMGDNGQGDHCAAESMLIATAADESSLPAVFVHKVKSFDDQLNTCRGPGDSMFDLTLMDDGAYGGRVHYHETHVEAATIALDEGFISPYSAQMIANEVNAYYDYSSCEDLKLSSYQTYCGLIKNHMVLLEKGIEDNGGGGAAVNRTDFHDERGEESSVLQRTLINIAAYVAVLLFVLSICCCCYRCAKKSKYAEKIGCVLDGRNKQVDSKQMELV